ncbi:hypothetical protein JTB14_036448, partial [Gonioctena quinquepunctata]
AKTLKGESIYKGQINHQVAAKIEGHERCAQWTKQLIGDVESWLKATQESGDTTYPSYSQVTDLSVLSLSIGRFQMRTVSTAAKLIFPMPFSKHKMERIEFQLTTRAESLRETSLRNGFEKTSGERYTPHKGNIGKKKRMEEDSSDGIQREVERKVRPY